MKINSLIQNKNISVQVNLLDEIDKDILIDEWGKDNLYSTDFYISKNIYIELILYSNEGVLVVGKADKVKDPVSEIKKNFGVNGSQAVIVVSESGAVYSEGLIEKPDIEDAFSFCLDAIDFLKAETSIVDVKKSSEEKEYSYEGITYVIDEDQCEEFSFKDIPRYRVDDDLLTRIYALTKAFEERGIPAGDKNTYTDTDGNTYVRKYRREKIFGIDTGLTGEKEWYRQSNMDPDTYAIKTALFGVLGIHKFIVGHILEGIIYLLTFGGAGILPVIDVISLISGEYLYKKNTYTEDGDKITDIVYLKKITKAKVSVLCLLCSIFMGIISSTVIYPAVLKGVSAGSAAVIEQIKEKENIENRVYGE